MCASNTKTSSRHVYVGNISLFMLAIYEKFSKNPASSQSMSYSNSCILHPCQIEPSFVYMCSSCPNSLSHNGKSTSGDVHLFQLPRGLYRPQRFCSMSLSVSYLLLKQGIIRTISPYGSTRRQHTSPFLGSISFWPSFSTDLVFDECLGPDS